MAWLNFSSGADAALDRAPVRGHGADIWDFVFHRRVNGDEYLFSFDGSVSTGSAKYMKIYRNGTLIATETILSSGFEVGGVAQPVVILPSNGRCFWIKISGSIDTIVTLYEFSFETDTSISKATIAGEARGNYRDVSAASICHDPVTDKMYVSFGSAQDHGQVTTYRKLIVQQFSSLGVLDHTVINKSGSGGGYAYTDYGVFSSTAYNGTLYFDLYDNETYVGTFMKLSSISGDLINQTSWTTVDSQVGGPDSFRHRLINYNLYIHPGQTTLRSPGATTWDLSSYLDSDRNIGVLRKIDSGDNYEILSRKGTTVYALVLASTGTVGSVGSRIVTSDYYTPSSQCLSHPSYKEGSYPDGLLFGSAKRFLEVVPLIKDVV